MKTAVLLTALALAPITTANAQQLPLVCTGSVNLFESGKMAISASGAVVDLEARTFTAPVYGTYPIVRSDETSISFASETDKASTYGTLDRISGKMTMNVMTPAERKKLAAGQSVKFLSYVEAMCAPARKMF